MLFNIQRNKIGGIQRSLTLLTFLQNSVVPMPWWDVGGEMREAW